LVQEILQKSNENLPAVAQRFAKRMVQTKRQKYGSEKLMNVAQEPIKGFMKQKIKAHINKTQPKNSRARASTPTIILRAQKKLKEVLNEFPSEAVSKAIEVLEGQLTATKKMWDVNAKCMIEIPDEKIRQDAALAILAYEWGRPVERKMVAQGGLRDMKELLARVEKSPAYQESLRKAVECKEVTPALPPHDNSNG
jgi:hypothetical protein